MRFGKRLKYLILISLVGFNFAWFGSEIILENINNLDENPLNDDLYDESTSFIHAINGKKYIAKFITKEDVEGMKKQLNDNINSQGTGSILPTEKELDDMVGELTILGVYDEQDSEYNLRTSAPINDISNETYFPEVRSQGAQGSCASWSVVYYSMGYLEAKDNSWDASSGNESCLLSPAWAYNKLSDDGATGTSLYGNAKLLTELGAPTWSAMPYNQFNSVNWGNSTAWNEAPYHRSLSYGFITYAEATIINTIKNIIDSKTPVSFCLNSSEYDDGFLDSNYIISSSEYDLPSPSTTIDHANTIVGYNDSISDDGDIGAFKVVNSWGSGWGDNGYYWLTYDAFKEIEGYGDIMYLNDRPDYQPTLIANWTFSPAPAQEDDIITLGVGPYGSPYDTITPDYYEDTDDLFPIYMALDISDFYPYYQSDPDVNFYLSVGSSTPPGAISSFKIKRYISGVLMETTNESADVPLVNPGYVTNHFENIHILTSPTIISPNGGEIEYMSCLIKWTASSCSWAHSITYEVQYSINGSAWISITMGITENSYSWNITSLGYSNETLIKVVASCSGGLNSEDQSDAYFILSLTNPERKVPGYDLLLILGVIGIISILYTRSRRKKSNII